MSVTVYFHCGGCNKCETGTRSLRRRFVGISGKPYGFGHYECETPQDVAPDGWVAFDPYTGCCYCPDCWSEINETSDDDTG